jgi:hypothetical protein
MPPKKIDATATNNERGAANGPYRIARFLNILPGTVFADHWRVEESYDGVLPASRSDNDVWLLVDDTGRSAWVEATGKNGQPHHLALMSFAQPDRKIKRAEVVAVTVDLGEAPDLEMFSGLDDITSPSEPRQDVVLELTAFARAHLRDLIAGLRAGSDDGARLVLSDDLEKRSTVPEIDSAIVSLNNWLAVAKAPARFKRAHNKGGNRAVRLFVP